MPSWAMCAGFLRSVTPRNWWESARRRRRMRSAHGFIRIWDSNGSQAKMSLESRAGVILSKAGEFRSRIGSKSNRTRGWQVMLDRQVAEAIADAFGLETEDVTAEFSPSNAESWDSAGHLKLILHLEDVFQIRFPANEIPALTTAGRIQDALRKMNALH